MSFQKSWVDQPKEVEGVRVIFSAFVSPPDRAIEVRRREDGYYYVTQGTLFGSQTLLCDSADSASGK